MFPKKLNPRKKNSSISKSIDFMKKIKRSRIKYDKLARIATKKVFFKKDLNIQDLFLLINKGIPLKEFLENAENKKRFSDDIFAKQEYNLKAYNPKKGEYKIRVSIKRLGDYMIKTDEAIKKLNHKISLLEQKYLKKRKTKKDVIRLKNLDKYFYPGFKEELKNYHLKTIEAQKDMLELLSQSSGSKEIVDKKFDHIRICLSEIKKFEKEYTGVVKADNYYKFESIKKLLKTGERVRNYLVLERYLFFLIEEYRNNISKN